MILKNIEAVEAEKKAKPNEGLITNSIKLKKDSYENVIKKALIMMAEKNLMEAALNEKITKEIVADVPNEKVVGRNYNAAVEIQNLGDNISILGIDGLLKENEVAVAKDGNRAIRLIDRMIKNVKANSDMIYKEIVKNNQTEMVTEEVNDFTASSDNSEVSVEVAPIENTPVVDVQQILQKNQEPVKESIESAINEESLEYGDVSDVVDEFISKDSDLSINNINDVVNKSITDAEVNTKDDTDAINKEIVNERLNNFVNSDETEKPVIEVEENPTVEANQNLSSIENEEEYEYKVMTDDEVSASQIKINEVPLRDESIVVPEREDVSSLKEEKTSEVSENEETRSINVSQDGKAELEKLRGCTFEQIQEIIAAKEAENKRLQEENKNTEQDLLKIKEDYAEIVESKAAAEKKVAELDDELREMMIDTLVAIENENSDITKSIHSKQEEWDGIKAAGDKVYNRINELDNEALSKQEQIDKYREMKDMFSVSEKSQDEESIQIKK